MVIQKPKRIHLVGDGRHEEGVAAGVITPGHLIALDENGKYVVHPNATKVAEKLFALEDALQGRTILTDYAVDDQVMVVCAETADVVYAFLAPGEACDPSDFLTSNGDGTLKVGSDGDYPVGVPLETLDNSDSSGSLAARIRVRVI